MTRQCSKCKDNKNLDEFYKDAKRPLGRSYLCKECSKSKRRNDEIRARYGITELEYKEKLNQQNGVCAICTTSDPGTRVKRFSIDHNHSTSSIRALLCNSCNNGLGRFKDNPELLEKAASYIRSYNVV